MKKRITYTLFIIIQGFGVSAQSTFYDFIKLGDFQVGYNDTIVFDANYQYVAFDYCGMKPHFIQIWYPLIEKINNPDYLKVNDFFEGPKTNTLFTIQTKLKNNYRESVIRDCIANNLASGEANDFGNFSNEDILNMICETKTKSIMQKDFKPSTCPVIVYHHGAQSYLFENYIMAEYFASRGFIFVAANFHLPYENIIFGLKPFDKIIKDEDEQSLKTVLKYARSLTNSSSVFFIGHSYGAQMGFRTFDHDASVTGFISLETSIEFKIEKEQIEDMWPEVYSKVTDKNVSYPFPILMCAATGQEKPFAFFENLNAKQVIFASTKAEFEHNAYLSSFYFRLFIDKKVMQSDKEILQERLLLYAKHIELINEFMEEVLKNRTDLKNETRFVK